MPLSNKTNKIGAGVGLSSRLVRQPGHTLLELVDSLAFVCPGQIMPAVEYVGPDAQAFGYIAPSHSAGSTAHRQGGLPGNQGLTRFIRFVANQAVF